MQCSILYTKPFTQPSDAPAAAVLYTALMPATVLQGTVAAVSCKDAIVDYGNVELNNSDRGQRQIIHCKHKDWVTQVGLSRPHRLDK